MERMLADYHHAIDPYWKKGASTSAGFARFIRKNLKDPSFFWLIAKAGQKYIGFFEAQIKENYVVSVNKVGYIPIAFVMPNFRRKGLSREALEIIFDWFKSKKIKAAEISVDTRNTPAVRSWERLGFKEYTKTLKKRV